MLRLTAIDIWTTAKLYDADYAANEVAADEKYTGKKILLIGTVASINKDFIGDAFIVLEANNPFLGVHAGLNDRGMLGAARLKKGMTIYLVCDSGTRIMGSATARNCQRFSQYSRRLITDFLIGSVALPRDLGEQIAVAYLVGSESPSASLQFTVARRGNMVAHIPTLQIDDAKFRQYVLKAHTMFPSLRMH
jgi:hypothetical protein